MTEKKAKPKRKLGIVDILLYLIIVLVLLIGLGFLAYPTVSDWWNNRAQANFVTQYSDAVSEVDPEILAEFREAARVYNEELPLNIGRFSPSEEDVEAYKKYLDPAGNGVMGYVTIPKIGVRLPIYHTAEEEVIQVAVGHVVGSSLPIGGDSTHSVLSSHRGLPQAKLFTHLDQLEVGDTFQVTVLGEILTYEVSQIDIVLPTDMSLLAIEEGEDLCTLVTCTPYGVNTHRMLVRGSRIPTPVDHEGHQREEPIVYDVMEVLPWYIYAVFVAVFGLIAVITISVFKRRKS